MELASMLAGERFTDHPKSVCPVIATLLRTYNDLVDDDRRQELYGYAAKVVGTRRNRGIERERARLCADFLEEEAGPERRLSHRGGWRGQWVAREAGRLAASSLRPACHSRVLALVDRLVDVGRQRSSGEVPEVTVSQLGGERSG